MRIAIFTETYLPDVNGVATHIKTLKDGLEAIGHTVLIVKSDASSRRNYIDKGVMHCPAITSKKLYNYSLSSPVSLKRLQILKKWNPDIIHIQNEFGIGLSGAFIAKILKKPLVYTLHTMYDDYIYYIAPKPFVQIVTKASHKYFCSLAKKATAITGASKKIEDYFRECGVTKPINIIPNAVELDMFDEKNINQNEVSELKKQYNLTDDITAFCFCGRVGREKNIHTLLKFWSEHVNTDDKMRLLIFGSGPALEELTEMSKELKIDSQITFCGKIPHTKLVSYYAMCTAYITASLSENFSISMLEAMASGLPVIHLYDKENECQVHENVNGFVYHNSDEMYSIMTKIRNLSLDDKNKMQVLVRQSVKQSGSVELAKYVSEIYNNIYKK